MEKDSVVNRRWLVGGGIFLLGMLLAAGARADTVILNSGGTLQGNIIMESSDNLQFKLVGGGVLALLRKDIKEVRKETEVMSHVHAGDFWVTKGEAEKALLEYAQALELDPRNQEINNRINTLQFMQQLQACQNGIQAAQDLLKNRDYRQALLKYEDLLKESPTREMAAQLRHDAADAHAQLAFLYYNHVYTEGALRELAKAEALDSEVGFLWYVSGRIKEDEKDYVQAERDYQRAVGLDPNLTKARDHLLTVQKRLDDEKKARTPNEE